MGNLIWILTRWPESTERAVIRLCLCHTIFINFKVIYRKLKKMSQFQKQPPELLYWKSCSSKFRNIYRKTHKLESPFNRLGASSPTTFFKRDSNTGVVNIAKFLRTLILMKICEQLLLQFLLLTVNISSWVLVSALNSIGLLQRSS